MKSPLEIKRGILATLFDRTAWENTFNPAHFARSEIGWRTRIIGGLSVGESPDGKEYRVSDSRTGAEVTLRKNNNELEISDESGTQTGPENALPDFNQNVLDLAVSSGTPHADLSTIGVSVTMTQRGHKLVFDHNTGRKYFFEPPAAGKMPTAPVSSRFFHRVHFDFNTAAQDDYAFNRFMTYAKLVVAKDLGLQPGLKALNEPDERAFFRFLSNNNAQPLDMETLSDFNPDDLDSYTASLFTNPAYKDLASGKGLSGIQKPWHDSVQFRGWFAEVPQSFMVETRDGGFDIRTSLDGREAIWSCGEVMKATEHAENAVTDFSARHEDIPGYLLAGLQGGGLSPDHRNNAWSWVVWNYRPSETPALTAKLREIGRQNFGLAANEFSVVHKRPGECVAAMRNDALIRTTYKHEISVQMRDMIVSGTGSKQDFEDLLRRGADPRFLDMTRMGKGRTFQHLAEDLQAYNALRALQDLQGIIPSPEA